MSRPTLPPALWREAVWRWALKTSQRRQDRPRDTLLLTHRGLRDMLRLSQRRRVYMPMPMPTDPMPPWFNDPNFADDTDLADLGHLGHLGDLSNNMQWRMPGLRYTERLPTAPLWAAARGWCVGALLLAAALLLARLADRCLRSRRRLVEWPTADVLATSNRGTDLWNDTAEADMPEPYSDNSDAVSNDFPPPYGQCSEPGAEPKPPPYSDEPPPPYSACYVAVSGPKDEGSSAQLLNGHRQNRFADSSLENVDTGQTVPNGMANRITIDGDCVNSVDLRIPSVVDDNGMRENMSVAI